MRPVALRRDGERGVFRRDFDAEVAGRARGAVGVGCPGAVQQIAAREVPESREVVIPSSPRILDRLLALRCHIKPAGKDWHIRCTTTADTERVVGLCKLNGIHGILRRAKRA